MFLEKPLKIQILDSQSQPFNLISCVYSYE